jgi:acyl carrier protein
MGNSSQEQRGLLAEKVVGIIAAGAKRAPGPVTTESTFDELGLDSLDALNILYELEKEFNVHFPNEEVLGIRSVSQVIERLQRFLGAPVPQAQ